MIVPDASRSQEPFDVGPGASHRQILPDCGLYILWDGTHVVGHFEVSENLFMGGYNSADGSDEPNATEQDSKGNAFHYEAPIRLRAYFLRWRAPKKKVTIPRWNLPRFKDIDRGLRED